MRDPRVLVFTTLFPSQGQPTAGLFIRERMFRVAAQLPLAVVAPVPWFPFQGLVRRWRPHFRPPTPRFERQAGIPVYHPRFFSVPGLFKYLDGLFIALSCFLTIKRVQRDFQFNLIDAHFAYPDGYAATLLGRWLGLPVTITLRGTEQRLSLVPACRKRMIEALQRARRIFAVSESLKEIAIGLGIEADKIKVVGNGVDGAKFHPVDRRLSRSRYRIPDRAKVLVSVGGLVPRKGFHRVLEVLPQLSVEFPDLYYLIVGGGSPEGDNSVELKQQVSRLGLEKQVMFLGQISPDELKHPLSAADVFVLATANEGWANVFLEAMACGLPVVTTDVGGNREVISDSTLGKIVPFGDAGALRESLSRALRRDWDRQAIIRYAARNSWDQRVAVLVGEFTRLVDKS